MSCGCNSSPASPLCATPAPVTTLIPGPPGGPGTDGSTWYDGSDVPSVDIGVDGDYYLRTDGQIYTKQSGVWIAVMDIMGEDGTVWFAAAGAPGAGTGDDGDFYLNTTNGDVYTKSGGAWGSPIMNITGPAGPAGATGATGATGPAGNSFVFLAVSDVIFDPTDAADEILNNFPTTSGTKSFGVFDGETGTYDIVLTICVGWNTVGAGNGRNIAATLFSNATPITGIKNASVKSGGTYGGVYSYTRIIRGVSLTYGETLTVVPTGTGDIYLVESSIQVVTPYTPYVP